MLLLSAPDPADPPRTAADQPSTAGGVTEFHLGSGDVEQDDAADDLVASVMAWPDDGRFTLRANMIASIDGGATVDGTSGGLGIEDDQRMIGIQRDLADAVLVGAGTLIAENYPGARSYPKRRRRRERWQRSPVPPWIIVASRPLPADLRAVTESAEQAIVISPDDVQQPAQARIVRTGGRLDLSSGLRQLADLGLRRVLCEGGPRLLGELAAADLLDELCLTIAPTLLGTGTTTPLLGGADLAAEPRSWQLASLLRQGGHLFTRYRRAR